MDQEKFIKGFNHGYTLQEQEPELLAKILKSPASKSDYLDGIKEGQKQYEREKLLKQLEQGNKTKDREKER